MIKIIISGEGNSDVGKTDHDRGEFIPGPITVLTRNILSRCDKDDVHFHLRTRSELKRYPITLKGKKREDKGTASGKGHSDLAYKLAYIAKENKCHIAILMRDADNRDFDMVYNEIQSGFSAAKFEHGIPAVPVPASEAWIICCISPEKCLHIENCSDDMKALLEQLLLSQHKSNDEETWSEIATDCNIEKVRSDSFRRYMRDIENAVQYLS